METNISEEVVAAHSQLGRKEFWDDRYRVELDNFAAHGDEGEVWFGKSAENRMVDYVLKLGIDQQAPILDVGTGNGSLLRRLSFAGNVYLSFQHAHGFHNLTGVDYSEGSIDLCLKLSENCHDIRYYPADLLNEEDVSMVRHLADTFDLILDKGTWDAMSLAGNTVGDLAKYKRALVRCLKNGRGRFLICSCNFTKDELVSQFSDQFQVEAEIPAAKTFTFGGGSGTTSTAVCFIRR